MGTTSRGVPREGGAELVGDDILGVERVPLLDAIRDGKADFCRTTKGGARTGVTGTAGDDILEGVTALTVKRDDRVSLGRGLTGVAGLAGNDVVGMKGVVGPAMKRDGRAGRGGTVRAGVTKFACIG